MAEFCVSCWNIYNETDIPEEDFILSPEYELCEGCGEFKHTILCRRKSSFPHFILVQGKKWLSKHAKRTDP